MDELIKYITVAKCETVTLFFVDPQVKKTIYLENKYDIKRNALAIGRLSSKLQAVMDEIESLGVTVNAYICKPTKGQELANMSPNYNIVLAVSGTLKSLKNNKQAQFVYDFMYSRTKLFGTFISLGV